MDALRITGGVPLEGTVVASGAKNAALPIMAAALLADCPVVLERVPELRDVRTLSQLLMGLGLSVARDALGNMILRTIDPVPVRANAGLVRRMRASFCVLGPLLARRGRAIVPLPGGCAIGDRPVDLHLHGLVALGADIQIQRGYVVARASRLRGARIHLAGQRGPTVTGTANVMSAATLAHGTTIMTGAATEPEIVDLGRFLVALGARIEGLGTSTIEIQGVRQLGGACHRLIPDRIEAATLLCAAAITRGSITVRDAEARHMTAVIDLLREMGAAITVDRDAISLQATNSLRPITIVARPYPDIPTDMQSQLTALATLSTGRSCIEDHLFPERFHHVRELRRMGAVVHRTPSGATIHGVSRLSGATVTATDLRASASLVLAGLAAEGVTVIQRISHLDRGYERLEEKLSRLGARVKRIRSPAVDPLRGHRLGSASLAV